MYNEIDKWKNVTDRVEAEQKRLALGAERYEKLRLLSPLEFSSLFSEALHGQKKFDQLVDELPGKKKR